MLLKLKSILRIIKLWIGNGIHLMDFQQDQLICDEIKRQLIWINIHLASKQSMNGIQEQFHRESKY